MYALLGAGGAPRGVLQHLLQHLMQPVRPAGGVAGAAGRALAVFPPPQRVQDALNEQIGMELDASMRYQAMAAYFSRVEVSLRGMARMVRVNADEEWEHGERLVRWLASRGGQLSPRAIAAPTLPLGGGAWEAVRAAVLDAIAMEQQVTQSLLRVHQLARSCEDVATADFISRTMLAEQVQAMYIITQVHTKLKRVEESTRGLHLFDEMLYHKYKHS